MDEAASERSIRDLMGLLALPALWAGRDSNMVLQITTEAVERIVPLRFICVHLGNHAGQVQAQRFRVDGEEIAGDALAQWSAASSAWPIVIDVGANALLCDTPLGPIRAVRLRMEYGPSGGSIWFGSSSPDFPTLAQLIPLRAATSLASTGLQTARALHEREEAIRAKDEFLAMLGHESRNPLAPIVAALDLMRYRNPVLSLEYTIIERQVTHLRQLVDDLLDVARITRGEIALSKEVLDLHTVLNKAIEGASPLLAERGHAMRRHFAKGDAIVFGDALRLTQIFANLLINAAKYTDPHGAISITTRIAKDRITAAIRDNGSGISPELYPRLFTIFEQGSNTIDRSRGGLGIGLALVKKFAELHGGTVDSSRAGLGQGSEFTVTLPLASRAPRKPSPSAKPMAPSRSARILVIDDNIDALTSMALLLRACGHDVATASDPLEALAVAAHYRPTVALVDIGLPIMDDYQLCRELRRQFPAADLRLIALTGYGQESDRARSASAGFDAHMVKPMSLEDLNAAINGAAPSAIAATAPVL